MTVILGVAVFGLPAPGYQWAFCVELGVYLLITALGQAFFAFGVSTVARAPLFISSIALIGLGVWAIHSSGLPLTAVALAGTVAFILSIGFLCRGAAETAAGSIDRGLPGWAWRIGVGVVSLLVGVVILAVPSVVFRSIVAASCLLLVGVCEIVSSFAMRKASRRASSVL